MSRLLVQFVHSFLLLSFLFSSSCVFLCVPVCMGGARASPKTNPVFLFYLPIFLPRQAKHTPEVTFLSIPTP